MKITALDITHRRFARKMRGYDPEEVHAFLGDVAEAFEALTTELQGLQDEVSRKDEEMAELRSRERVLQDTLITAQKTCEELRDNARKEADLLVAEAELQADRIVQGAHARFQRIVDDIGELKRQRIQLAAQLRSVLRAHDKLVEAFGDGEREDRVEFLPARKKTADEAAE
ncbi:MAG TPA: DivIVA domain-containing protein [Anaeromyxobacteraceae bacterium]|nr:DivIVA domain-containing protein [Anaeromyxobacteraceae bacterium]